ncbi:MAG: sulfite exporter TauE/SafE family protein [Saprospirales bacterium]|nr:MAG: sulfite exporter TauE/SafE family protein [Saprospirales bacterium]
MDWLNELAQNPEMPLLAALALGLLTSIAPCPLATNITATGFIAKSIGNRKRVFLSGIFYTVGRMFSYTALGAIIFFGVSSFEVSKIFQGNGEKFLGFILIFIGLIMLDVIKFNFLKGGNFIDSISSYFNSGSLTGAFSLGALFALAFCPYSGALFFAMLIPMTLSSGAGIALPAVYAVGTGLPVIFFALLIAFSVSKVGSYFQTISKVEKVMRIAVGLLFIATGLYYINIYFGILNW